MQNKSEIKVTITQNLPIDSGQDSNAFEGTLAELAEKVKVYVTEDPHKGWISVNFETPPLETVRVGLVETFQQVFEATDWQKTEKGDRGERVEIDKAFQPSFSLCEYEEGCDYIVGFWYNDTSFLLYAFDISEELGGEGISITHWHPDSRCSGSWQDSYSFITDSLSISHTLNDDDGYYIEFIAGNFATPSAKAIILDAVVYSWDLYLAEHRLLQAYFLGFTSGDIGLLFGENEGYDIEELIVNLSSSVLEELQSYNSAPDQEEAAYWLDGLESTLNPDDYIDHPLTTNLRKIAEIETTAGSASE